MSFERGECKLSWEVLQGYWGGSRHTGGWGGRSLRIGGGNEGSKGQIRAPEPCPGGWAGPWGQLGANMGSGGSDNTDSEVQTSHPGWGGCRREALAKGVGGSGVGGGGQCRHGQLNEAKDQAGRLQERAWQARLSGREGGILNVHEFVLIGLVEWTRDLKKIWNYAFSKHFGKKKKKTCLGLFKKAVSISKSLLG